MLNNPELSEIDDDYVNLLKLRQNKTELDHFLSQNKPFHQHYSDVLFCAIEAGIDCTSFAQNLNITNMHKFTQIAAWFYKNIGDFMLKFNEQSNRDMLSIKEAYLFSNIALALLQKIKDDSKAEPEAQIQMFETATRLSDLYFSIVYKPTIYSETSVNSLPPHEGFVYHAAKGYKLNDNGDTLGFIKSLRTAMQFNPNMLDTISLISDKILKGLS